MTKQLISSAGGINTFIDAKPLTNPQHAGWTHVKISSTAEWAKDPTHEQVKLDLCLEPEEFANLKAVINSL